MEEWKDIPGYEGIYQASNMGNIRSAEGKQTTSTRFGGITRTWRSKVIRQTMSKNAKGRTDARVKLWKNKQMKTFLVARLVGMAWVSGYSE